MTKEISAGIEGDTELGDQVSNHTVQYLLLDHRKMGYNYMYVYKV